MGKYGEMTNSGHYYIEIVSSGGVKADIFLEMNNKFLKNSSRYAGNEI